MFGDHYQNLIPHPRTHPGPGFLKSLIPTPYIVARLDYTNCIYLILYALIQYNQEVFWGDTVSRFSKTFLVFTSISGFWGLAVLGPEEDMALNTNHILKMRWSNSAGHVSKFKTSKISYYSDLFLIMSTWQIIMIFFISRKNCDHILTIWAQFSHSYFKNAFYDLYRWNPLKTHWKHLCNFLGFLTTSNS